MSTTFGIHRYNEKVDLIDDDIVEKYEGYIDKEFIPVAFRGNGGWMVWKNELALFLPDELLVYPLDNTAQGIYTIGDIKREMKEYHEHE